MVNKTLGPKKTERIPSIDFWRGAFLLMIYLNHIPGNFLGKLTLRNWGFADSVEAFVFISGFSAMLAFGRYFEFGGFGVGIIRTAKRAWQLFCAHILLVIALAATIAFAGIFVDTRPVMVQFNFLPLFDNTSIALPKLLRLGYLPNLADILPLYIVLIFFFPVAWLLVRTSSVLALGVSFFVWLGVAMSGLTIPNYPVGAKWFFNPVAWQLLFVCGMVAFKERTRASFLLRSNVLFGIALFVVGFSCLVVAPWARFEAFASWHPIPMKPFFIDNKANLVWFRAVHFLALAFIAMRLIPNTSSFWNHRLVKTISLCGRHSLAVFCSGTVLSMAAHIILRSLKPGPIESFLIVLSGVVALVLLASAIQKTKALLGEAEARARAAKKPLSLPEPEPVLEPLMPLPLSEAPLQPEQAA